MTPRLCGGGYQPATQIWYTGTVWVDRLQRLVSVECGSVADVIHTALQDRVAVRELIARRAARASASTRSGY